MAASGGKADVLHGHQENIPHKRPAKHNGIIGPVKPRHAATKKFLKSGLFSGLRSFVELEQRIADLPTNGERGDAFEVFAEALFSTQTKYQAKMVWPDKTIPPQIAKRLLLPVKDMGVDGIVETHSGDLIAYQVKFRSNRPALSWRELSTFVGLSEKADQRMIVTNCDNLAEIVKHRPNMSSVRGNHLDRLEERDFRAIRSWLSSGEVKRKKKTPFPYQRAAIRDIRKHFEKVDRTTAVMACGSGKTLVSLWVAEAEEPKNVLVLLPSLALVSQIFGDWSSETKWKDAAYMCVCSDQSVGKRDDSMTFDQADLDFKVTTDSADVAEFLRRRSAGPRIVFSTYQSSKVVAEAMPKRFKFDLGVFDEAHKTAGRGSIFTFALEDTNLPIRKRLFLTATPRHYNISKRTKEGDASLVYSMDSEGVYGTRAHTLTFGAAVDQDIICDYKVLISVVTDEMVDSFARKHGEVNVKGDLVKAQQVANQLALAKAVEEFGVERIFTFHRTVASAKSFSAEGAEGVATHLPDFSASHVSGVMRTSMREARMKEFRLAPKAVLSNARCLTEGVDVPAVDMVAFMSPKKSKVDIVQATGRAMRKSGGKKCGYVLVPLYLEEHAGEDVETAIERTDFEEVWNVLQAMQEHDEELADIIRQLREERGRTKGFNDSRLREKVSILGPALTLKQIREPISIQLINRLGVTWDERLGELKAFREEHGHCDVPKDYGLNPRLGTWCANLRTDQKNGQLSDERLALLEAIDFDFSPLDTQWNEMLHALIAFKEEYNHCNVPQHYDPNSQLGAWCGTQRWRKNKGELSDERIALLDAIDFDFDPFMTLWNEKYDELIAFQKEHNHCNVPRGYPLNPPLARWCGRQRAHKKSGRLGKEQIALLEAVNFVFDKRVIQWNEMARALVAFEKEHGHSNVPSNHEPNPTLGRWCSKQRADKKKGTLSNEQVAVLETIKFDFNFDIDQHGANWRKMYETLIAFNKEYGHSTVPQKFALNPQLGTWCSEQRKRKKKGQLSNEQVALLEAINFDFDRYVTQWNEMFHDLIAFKEEHNHCNVPRGFEPNPQLSTWIGDIRKRKKKGQLSNEQVALLEAIDFDFDPFTTLWNEKYDELIAFEKEHNHCNVPQKYEQNPTLGAWCSTQRTRRKNGKLSDERIAQLEAVGFEWN